MATKFENKLISAMKKANNEYSKMTGGYWLNHAPESFAQAIVARELGKDVCVYPECNPKKMKRDSMVDRRRGPMPGTNPLQRFDLVVFWRNESLPRAIVEIKFTYASMKGVISDAEKILRYRKEASRIIGLRHGYLLAFNYAYKNANINKERQGDKTIRDRFLETTKILNNKGFVFVNNCFVSRGREGVDGNSFDYFGVGLWRHDFP